MTIPLTNYLRVKVIPKSPKTELKGVLEDSDGEKTYKIAVKAPPEKGKANIELIKFLSKELSIPKETISIISGTTDRIKLIKIKL
jgi:hypothetical protein